ncbi:hypothetical protein MLD38_035681 [Melastoma candidum]|uniref:Uncharacterized protein n=1 Tax=Melastoma candidum TaxID=119954 RepID=A0ACB9LHA1_9MYRT|nr:hypothetical protein MLD38_035681 [Melastoma candidum]
MGKGNWFSSVKKALSPDSKERKHSKSKKKWFGKQKGADPSSSPGVAVAEQLPPPVPTRTEELDLTNGLTEESADVPAVPVNDQLVVDNVVQDTPAVVPPRGIVQLGGKSREEAAAIKIQRTFRGYQARKAARALRGLVRLKSLVEGPTVKRQVASTLRCMQTLSRVQSQIHSRRIRMSEENEALHRQLLQKRARDLENLKIGEEWDDSMQSKEQIEEKLLKKFDATMRRERALAYSFTHQQTWKNSAKPTNQTFLDPNNPTWGWSWLERWMAARPWESRMASDKESANDNSSVRNANYGITGEISTSYARYQLNMDKNSPTASQKSVPGRNGFQSPLNPSKPSPGTLARKIKSASPKVNVRNAVEDDAKSMVSAQSEFNRRHSIGGASSVRDDESLGSSSSLPSYMVATESARAKSRLQNLSGPENSGTPEKGSTGPAKKRLSYPPSPGRVMRRHSGPPKLNTSVETVNSITNGVVS